MKNFIELKYHNNSKFEIVFENLTELKEDDRYVIFLKEGDVRPLALFLQYTTGKLNDVYIPYVTLKQIECLEISACCFKLGEYYCTIYTFDSIEDDRCNFENILPKWNIPEDSAILFLSEEDERKYRNFHKTFIKQVKKDNLHYYRKWTKGKGSHMSGADYPLEGHVFQNIKKLSLIVPELHAEDKSCPYHIDNINNICKELKEKYGVERIELFVSHCFVKNYLIDRYLAEYVLDIDHILAMSEHRAKHKVKYCIDKITTTNSTSILEVQKSDRLEVVDCVEFFKDNLLNIKQSI